MQVRGLPGFFFDSRSANCGIGIFGLGGFFFKGIYREIQQHMGETTHSYIIAARITEGHNDWETSTPEERNQLIKNYLLIKDDPMFKRKFSNSRTETN